MKAIQNFMDPFQVEINDKLYRFSSGATVRINIETDIMNAELSNTAAKEAFVFDRLRKHEQFIEPIKRLNQKPLRIWETELGTANLNSLPQPQIPQNCKRCCATANAHCTSAILDRNITYLLLFCLPVMIFYFGGQILPSTRR